MKMLCLLVQIIFVPAKATTRIKLPKLSIPKFDEDVLKWRTFWEQFGVSIHSRPELSDAEKLAYLKDALKDGPAERVIQGLAEMTGTYDNVIECLLNRYDRPHLYTRPTFVPLWERRL